MNAQRNNFIRSFPLGPQGGKIRAKSLIYLAAFLAITPLLTGCVTANMWTFDNSKSDVLKASLTPLTVAADATVIGCLRPPE